MLTAKCALLRLPWLLLPLFAGGACAQWNPLNPVTGVHQEADGVRFDMRVGVLRIQVCSDSIIRAQYSPTSDLPSRPDYVVTKTTWPAVQWKMESTDAEVALVTSRLRVTVHRSDGSVEYHDAAGKRLLQEGTRNMTPARVNGDFSIPPPRTDIVPVAYSPSTEKPLGLRYSFLRNAGGDEYREVDPDTVFHSGDRIRVAVQSNGEGYLYIVMKGASGTWKVLFPSAGIADGSNRVAAGRQTLIPPPPDRFAFDEQAGEERLFIVLSRQPEPSLEKLIYSLGSASPTANEPPKQLLSTSLAPVDDALVGRLRNQVYARDLIFEKVDDATPGDKKEKAVYVVNPTGSPESRLVADVTLKHR